MEGSIASRNCVVAAIFNGLRTEDRVQIMSIRLFIDPSANCGEHVPLDFNVLIPKGRVVEGTKYVRHDFFHGDARVLPCVEDPWGNILQYCCSDSASYWVQLVRKMILGEH